MLCVCVCARARACARVCVCVCSDMMASLNLRQTILALLISSVSERSVACISIVRLESKKHNHEMYKLIIKDVQVENIDV